MTLEDKVDKLVTDVAEIKAALKYNGIGLIPTFEQHCNQDREFRGDYYKFKRQITMILCLAAGSGALGAGIARILGG